MERAADENDLHFNENDDRCVHGEMPEHAVHDEDESLSSSPENLMAVAIVVRYMSTSMKQKYLKILCSYILQSKLLHTNICSISGANCRR